jgi:predicted transcriptional regulator
MHAKDELHGLVDQLPETAMDSARDFLEYLRDRQGDPVLRALRAAPVDDEELSQEDLSDLEEALKDLAAGRVVSHAEARRRLLLDE